MLEVVNGPANACETNGKAINGIFFYLHNKNRHECKQIFNTTHVFTIELLSWVISVGRFYYPLKYCRINIWCFGIFDCVMNTIALLASCTYDDIKLGAWYWKCLFEGAIVNISDFDSYSAHAPLTYLLCLCPIKFEHVRLKKKNGKGLHARFIILIYS